MTRSIFSSVFLTVSKVEFKRAEYSRTIHMNAYLDGDYVGGVFFDAKEVYVSREKDDEFVEVSVEGMFGAVYLTFVDDVQIEGEGFKLDLDYEPEPVEALDMDHEIPHPATV